METEGRMPNIWWVEAEVNAMSARGALAAAFSFQGKMGEEECLRVPPGWVADRSGAKAAEAWVKAPEADWPGTWVAKIARVDWGSLEGKSERLIIGMRKLDIPNPAPDAWSSEAGVREAIAALIEKRDLESAAKAPREASGPKKERL